MANGLDNRASFQHILETLDVLNRYQDFINNLRAVADMGCGSGLDSAWWAKLTKQDGTPRDIQVHAVDIDLSNVVARHPNVNFIQGDYTSTGIAPGSLDLVWAHDSLQYSLAPMHSLLHWWEIMRVDAMLVIAMPYNYTVNNHLNIPKVDCLNTNKSYFNWTLGNLIMALIATGFDCRNAHFKIDKVGNWIHAAVYKLPAKPDPHINWYDMFDRKLLPECIEGSIAKNGNFQDTELVVDWIDRSQYMLSI